MLRWIAKRRLAAFERTFDYDTTFMRDMVDVSWRGFLRFASVAKLSHHREDVPLEAWYAAKIVALMIEDCGPCTQLNVTMAERDGVQPAVLRGILAGDEAAMGPDAALAFRFARAALAHDGEADRWREQIEARWSQRAVVSLALVMAAARVFPTVKYALGYGHTCTRVRVGGAETRPAPLAA